jgi:hypothetical protein
MPSTEHNQVRKIDADLPLERCRKGSPARRQEPVVCLPEFPAALLNGADRARSGRDGFGSEQEPDPVGDGVQLLGHRRAMRDAELVLELSRESPCAG